MTRNLKALGLALVAVFALSAMATSTASAKTNGQFTAHNGGAVIINAEAETSSHFKGLGGINITCSVEEYTGPTITGAVSSLELTPHYEGCKTGTRGITVTHNECKYKFYNANDTKDGKTTEHEWRITTDLVCPTTPTEKKVEVHIYNTESHASGTWCTLTMFEADNKNLEGLVATSLTNTPGPANDITVHGAVTVRSETHGTCSAGLTFKTNSTLEVTGVTVTGENHLEEPTSIHIG